MAYQHAGAYRLMKYVDTAGNVEWIWNSRDGVTPFIVQSRQGLESRHTDWRQDTFQPDYHPKVGERVFVDLTIERAREKAEGYVERLWSDPEYMMSEHPFLGPMGKDGAAGYLAQQWFDDGRRPDLIEVTEEVLRRLTLQGYVHGTRPLRFV